MPTDRPYVDFQQVKLLVSIPEALDKLDLLGGFIQKGDTWTGVCPLAQHQHGPRPNAGQFKINTPAGSPYQLWRCFGDCQRSGDVVDLVKGVLDLSNEHVRFWFDEHFSDRLSTTKPQDAAAPASTPDEAPPSAEEPAAATSERKPPDTPLKFYLRLEPCQYLRDRGITDATAAAYKVGLCRRGMLNGYVAFPIRRHPAVKADENPVAYLGRLARDDGFSEAEPKWRLPTGFEKSRHLFGLHEAVAAESDLLVCVENPVVVLLLAQHNVPACSPLGSSLSDEQAELLVRTRRRIALCFDGDGSGIAGMRSAAGKLITRAWVRVMKLDEGQQPDDDLPGLIKRIEAL